jgi:hypothetical protein
MLNTLLFTFWAVLLQAGGVPQAIPLPPPPGTPAPLFGGPGNTPLLFGADPPAAQQPPGTAAVEGIVTILGSSDVVAGAVVEMRRTECGRTGGESLNASTGPDGRFSFKQVRAGNWCIGAAKAGGDLSAVEYQQRGYKGRGIAIPVADNQQIQDIRLAMPRTGAITGRVLDSDGEPRGHTRVQAMEAFYQNGKKRLYTLNAVQTNDRGEFSLFWLPPGEYYVSAVPEDPLRQNLTFSVSPPGMGGHRADAMPPVVTRKNLADGSFREEVYRPIYYGSGPDAERARRIDVRPGSTTSIELSFAGAQSPAFRIRGKAVNGVTGAPAEGAQLRLYPKDWTATAVVPFGTVDKAGNFEIRGVPPGSYALYAAVSMRDPAAPLPAAAQAMPAAQLQQLLAQRVNLGAAIPLGARLPLDVGNQHVENVALTLLPGGTLTGEFIFEGNLAAGLSPQQKSSFRVNLMRLPDIPGAALGGASAGGIAANALDTSFQLQSIFPGDFQVLVSPFLNTFSWTPPVLADPLSGIFVKAIRYGSADVLREGLSLPSHNPDQRLQIILAAGGRISGIVTNDRNEPMSNVKVVLVPDFSSRDREDLYRHAVTDTSGQFQIHGIAAGDYRAFAWEYIQDGAWQDPDVLRPAEARGRSVRIREGEQLALELVAIRGGGQ